MLRFKLFLCHRRTWILFLRNSPPFSVTAPNTRNYCTRVLSVDEIYSQSTSPVTSISKNEMNIRIPLCNVRHLNGMLNISLETFSEKDALTGKKIQNTPRKQFFLTIFILFSFIKDNFNITFYDTNIKLLTVILLNITHSITISLQHIKLQSLQILEKLRYMTFRENDLIQSTN